eukprot:6173092-Pleurochrysis_carterae.AAC.3
MCIRDRKEECIHLLQAVQKWSPEDSKHAKLEDSNHAKRELTRQAPNQCSFASIVGLRFRGKCERSFSVSHSPLLTSPPSPCRPSVPPVPLHMRPPACPCPPLRTPSPPVPSIAPPPPGPPLAAGRSRLPRPVHCCPP